MSKRLARARALISDIHAIQNQGRHSVAPVSLSSRPVTESVERESERSEVAPVVDLRSHVGASETSVPASDVPEGKVLIQLSGKIAVQLQLEESDELVEVRQRGDFIEICFADGKAIHLPLRNVA